MWQFAVAQSSTCSLLSSSACRHGHGTLAKSGFKNIWATLSTWQKLAASWKLISSRRVLWEEGPARPRAALRGAAGSRPTPLLCIALSETHTQIWIVLLRDSKMRMKHENQDRVKFRIWFSSSRKEDGARVCPAVFRWWSAYRKFKLQTDIPAANSQLVYEGTP